jgi:tricorn protease
VAVFELASGKTTVVTDGFATADSPAFSRDGKVLFFRASTEFGRRQFGLDMTASLARNPTANLYAAVLRKDDKSPLAPRSDEADREGGGAKKPAPGGPGMDGEKPEKEDGGKDGEEKPEGAKSEEKAEAAGKPPAGKPDAGPSIDVEGLDQRVVALPLPAGRYDSLRCGKDALFFLEREEEGFGGGRRGDGPPPGAVLKSFDFEERKAKEVAKGVASYDVSAGGKHLLLQSGGGWAVTNLSGKDEKKVAVDGVSLRVEPEAEWPQTLREVWRIQRDYFYDANLHGVDWPAMWERYRVFLPHVRHRADLNLLVGEMMGELSCGHEYVSGGEMPDAPDGVGTGLLGCDVEARDGRYRITRVYRGQNWNPTLRAPLTEPGVDARVGDFVLAVDGDDVRADRSFFAAFENTAGRQVELTLAADAAGTSPRRTTVVPIANDFELRRRAWVEGNRARVAELSKGRLAYVYMPDTGNAGLTAFDRDFYAQLDKEGLVLDERDNGGGKIADYVISVLAREVVCYWRNREGWLGKTPFGTLDGPKVMIVNERAGSGGDALPWMFKKLRLGPVVGARTWGGLVGISGYPTLMDGGRVTAASFGIVDTDGRWVVENEGVSPDFEVLETPKDCAACRDPQLEKAVELALEALAKDPPKKPPEYTPPHPR